MDWFKRLSAVPTAPPGHCANCHAALPKPCPPYCSQCGQETRIRPPTLFEFIQQFGGAYISTEGALWRTLWRLFFLPGQLTLEYFAGRRRHFVQPVRLYLTISVLALVAVKFSGALSFEQEPPDKVIHFDASDRGNIDFMNAGNIHIGMKDGQFFCGGVSSSICERVQTRLQMDPKATKAFVKELPRRFTDHLGGGMFVLLPLFALLLKLVYIDKRRRYTEHLVFALHLHAFWFAAALLLFSGVDALKIIAAVVLNAYPLVALERVYQTRWWSTALRAALLMLLHSIALGFGLSLMLLWTFFA